MGGVSQRYFTRRKDLNLAGIWRNGKCVAIAKTIVAEQKECPRCGGMGRPSSPHQQGEQDPKCSLCEGRGWVTDEICLGCGRPAFYRMGDDTLFCGRTECLERIGGESKVKDEPDAKDAGKQFTDEEIQEWAEYAWGNWERRFCH